MHSRPIVVEIWFRHEGGGLAVRRRDIVDDIFIKLHPVRHHGQRCEFHSEFVLSGRNFVVMLLWVEADLTHHGQHFGAHVLL